MLTLTFPNLLWLFAPLAFIAIWTLRRPTPRAVLVPSVALWKQVLENIPSDSSKGFRFRFSWLCVLVGCGLAILAASQLAWQTQKPSRRMAFQLQPGADVRISELRRASRAAVNQLAAADRVQFLLPEELGGPTDWLTP